MWEILGGLLLGTVVSGVLPLVNAELLVAGAAVAAPGIGVPIVAAVSAGGQMISKTLLFGVARWAPSRLPVRARTTLERTSQAVANRGGAAGSLVFTSAAVGLPPFYGVSLAAGALGMRLRSFVLSGAVGRLLRFGALAWAARHVGGGFLEAP
jgi:membrane protein YqaA with SNARE-associated domain